MYFFDKIIRETNAMSYFVTTPKEKITIPHKKYPTSEILRTKRIGTLNYCPKCKYKVDETYEYCPGCGFKF